MDKGTFWVIGVFAALIAGVIILALQPDTSKQWETLVREQLHVEPGVEMMAFATSPGRSGTGIVSYEAMLYFTPEQYQRYAATVADSSQWTFRPFTIRELEAQAAASPGATRWQPGTTAFHTEDRALRWLDWGGIQGQKGVWDVEEGRSFCLGVEGAGADQRIDSCRSFGPDHRPDFYLRALLDDQNQRLYVFAR